MIEGKYTMSVSLADLTAATVTLDGMLNDLPAYLPETRWNGWECPYFKVSDIRAARAAFDAYGATLIPDDGIIYRWDEATDLPSLIESYEDEDETYEHVTRMDIDGIEFVTIGWGGWVWSRQEPRVFDWEDGFTPYGATLDGATLTEYRGVSLDDAATMVERRSTVTRRPEWDGHPNATDYVMSDDFSAGEVEGEAAVWIDGLGYSLAPIA